MSKNDGGPAFPAPDAAKAIFGESSPDAFSGMTLRDYFAAKAMQGLLAAQARASSDRRMLAERAK